MSSEDTGGSLAGRDVEAAADAVRARDGCRDPETVRAALERVAEDGVVTVDAADDALAHASLTVSTAENRVEFAAVTLADAREEVQAAGVEDLAVVASRLDSLGDRASTLEDRAAALAGDLRALSDATDLYELGAGVRDLTDRADALQRDADALKGDVDDFAAWVGSHETRVAALADDVAALDTALADLAETLDAVAAGAADDDTGLAWAEASLRARAFELTLADLRAEREALLTWAARADAPVDRLDEVADSLDDAAERLAAAEDRLDTLARPAWAARFGPALSAVESDLAAVDPPVAWRAVSGILEEHRAALERAA